MDLQKKRQIQITLRQLAEEHARTVAALLSEALLVLSTERPRFDPGPDERSRGTEKLAESTGHQILNPQLLSVEFRGKSCFLGNTLPFRLMERLARQPNRYLSYQQLLDDVWHNFRSKEAVRSVVKVLRAKLRGAGLGALAAVIDGQVAGHYALMLDRLS